MMNRLAKKIGMKNSNFKNASGLTESGQYSTAKDIATLARYARKFSFIRNTVNKKSMRFRFSRGSSITLRNTNKLLRMTSHCNGMKTGYTSASGKTLVSSGEYNGKRVIVVILGSNSRHIWNDSKKLIHWALRIPSSYRSL